MTNNPTSGDGFDLASYDFPFSEDLVATAPAEPRDSSRLMVLDRSSGSITHARFRDLPAYLRPGDCLVLNRTKVLPARLIGKKSTGGKADLLLLRELSPGVWTALSADLKPGARVLWEGGVEAVAESVAPGEGWTIRFSTPDVRGLMERVGLPPLPPYILKKRKRMASGPHPNPLLLAGEGWGEGSDATDRVRYQTVYARDEGSVAAPTAGFHFTPELLDTLRAKGIATAEVTLHVGHGTFQPIAAGDIREHRMKSEWYAIPFASIEALEKCRREKGRVIPVGTTATRTLESFGKTRATEGWTDIFIRPGHEFHYVDALVTNFHQPRSTPLVLASALAGRERLRAAYEEAVALRYRLYSFGDAMLIV